MTKKHFIELADLARRTKPHTEISNPDAYPDGIAYRAMQHQWEYMVAELARFCTSQSPAVQPRSVDTLHRGRVRAERWKGKEECHSSLTLVWRVRHMSKAGPTVSGWTIGAIRAKNKEVDHHYFDKATMAYFNSRIEPRVYEGVGGVFFVTSEKPDFESIPSPRRWTVRHFDPESGHCRTAPDMPFWEMSRKEAMDAAKYLANGTYRHAAA